MPCQTTIYGMTFHYPNIPDVNSLMPNQDTFSWVSCMCPVVNGVVCVVLSVIRNFLLRAAVNIGFGVLT